MRLLLWMASTKTLIALAVIGTLVNLVTSNFGAAGWSAALFCFLMADIAEQRSRQRAFVERVYRDRPLSDGARLIADERERQVSVEGWTAEHDDDHGAPTLAIAGAAYACLVGAPGYAGFMWPFDENWFKPHGTVRNLTRAGALIAAAIDTELRSQKCECECHTPGINMLHFAACCDGTPQHPGRRLPYS